MNVIFNKSGVTKTVKVGFSWTVFFFGSIALAFRQQWGFAFLMLVLDIFLLGIIHMIYAFFANKHLAEQLVIDGWEVTPDQKAVATAAWGV